MPSSVSALQITDTAEQLPLSLDMLTGSLTASAPAAAQGNTARSPNLSAPHTGVRADVIERRIDKSRGSMNRTDKQWCGSKELIGSGPGKVRPPMNDCCRRYPIIRCADGKWRLWPILPRTLDASTATGSGKSWTRSNIACNSAGRGSAIVPEPATIKSVNGFGSSVGCEHPRPRGRRPWTVGAAGLRRIG